MRIAFDPFEEIIKIVKRKHPKARARIYFTDKLGHGKKSRAGCTVFPKNGGTPTVMINVGIPVFGAVEVLAHELAHVVTAGTEDDDHGPNWQKKFAWIHREYMKRFKAWSGRR